MLHMASVSRALLFLLVLFQNLFWVLLLLRALYSFSLFFHYN